MIYRKDLEVYRGILILFIYFYHCKYFRITGGYLGVDYFIILSGYFAIEKCINKDKNSIQNSLKFLFKKFLRLLPSSNLLLIIVCYNYKNIYINHPIMLLNDIKTSIMLYSNYHFYFQNTDYLYAGEDSTILLHYWYLSLEAQFCCIISLFIIFPAKYRILTLKVVFITSFIYNIIISVLNSSLCYLSIVSRMWQFLIFLFSNNLCHGNAILLFTSYSSIFTLLFVYNSKISYPGVYGILPTLFFSIIIKTTWNYDNIKIKIFEKIGNISYPFYLIHYILLKFIAKDCYSEFIILYFTLIMSYIWYNNFDILFKNSNRISIFIFVLVILLSIYCLSFIQANLNFLKNGLLYSYKIHPRLFIGLSPLLDLIEKEKCKNFKKYKNYILLIGDSHMSQWLPFFIYMSDSIHIMILFKWTHRQKVYYSNINYFSVICNKISNITVNYVVLSFFLTQFNKTIIDKNLIKVISRIKVITSNIYLIEDNPSHSRNPAYCLRNKKNKYCYGVLNYNSSYYSCKNIMNRVKLHYISLSSYYKINNLIPYIYKDILIYVDDNHLSIDFVTSLIPTLSQSFRLPKKNRSYNTCKIFYI